jgi:hypothetical protein
MVNPGAFRLCARCGASMETHLQETAGLRRTSPIQSPVPVDVARIGPAARAVLGVFVILLALGYVIQLLPRPASGGAHGGRVAPTSQGRCRAAEPRAVTGAPTDPLRHTRGWLSLP